MSAMHTSTTLILKNNFSGVCVHVCVCARTSVYKLTLYGPIGRYGFSHLTEDLSPW